MIERHGHSGQAWSFRRQWKTYRPAGGLVYKALESLDPMHEEDFWNVMKTNYRAKLSPPSSFGSIFHKVCWLPWPNVSVVAPFRRFRCGAWSEALECGEFREKMYHYDLRSAYRWAACQGLPILKSGQRVYDLETPDSIFAVEFSEGHYPPWHRDQWGLVTSEEIQELKIRPRLIVGVQFSRWFDFTALFAKIQETFPFCYKRISRAFWGRWNGETEVQQHGWKQGHRVRGLPNPLHNPIWSHWITSRVKRKLWRTASEVGGVHVQVDAVLCRDPLPVSDEPGGWQLKQEYQKGLWIQRTGYWGSGNLVVKRMGLNQREAEQWLMQKT